MRARWPRGLVAMLLAASAGALGAAAFLAGPAQAAPAACGSGLQPCPPSGTITASTTETSGTVTVTWVPGTPGATVTNPPPTPTIQWVAQPNPPPGFPQPPSGAVALSGQSCTPDMSGDLICTYQLPTGLLDNGYVLNGTYTVSATADDCALLVALCSASQTTESQVAVANPPVAPSGATAAIVPNSTPPLVSVTWNADPEPDIVGYQVFSGSSTTPFCQATTSVTNPLTYSCSAAPPANGSYTFHVVAYRYGATYSDLTADQSASAASASTNSVVVTGVSGTTTTTVAGAGKTLGSTSAGSTTTKSGTTGGTGSKSLDGTPGIIAASGATATTSGGGYNPTLPYGSALEAPTTRDPDAISVPAAPHKGSSVGTIAALGAGFLIAVIALHGLWLRSEVRRAGTLEAIEPES